MTVTRVRRIVNPRRKRVSARRSKARGTRNPATILTLGLLNPHRPRTKGKKVAKATKKQLSALRKARAARSRKVSNPRRRRARVSNHRRRSTRRLTASNPRRRRNSTKIYVMKRRNGRGRRRNPEMFGMRGAAAGKAILAGLVGVYATKTVTPMVANAIPQVGSSPIFSAIISAAIAWGGGMLLQKWDKTAAEGFMFGGFMQAGSQLLNLVVPSNPLSLSGLGDWVPARFAVPENPILRGRLAAGLPAAAPAGAGMGAAAMFR